MTTIEEILEHAWETRDSLTKANSSLEVRESVAEAINLLDTGKARVAEAVDNRWQVNQWLKKAVLLSFRLTENSQIQGGHTHYFDKVPSKFAGFSEEQFTTGGYRVVPPAMVRRGAYIAPDVVLMPSYVNIGAYVGERTMVDTWATVGSCAQIGKDVHLSGGVGIGGVLEPLQASPTIIEDNCFIGARSEIVEGVIVGHGSVISMGVVCAPLSSAETGTSKSDMSARRSSTRATVGRDGWGFSFSFAISNRRGVFCAQTSYRLRLGRLLGGI